jgi:hypothetical protein
VIDGLDEVESTRNNPLYLPSRLPQGVFLVVTTRRDSPNLRIECEQSTFDIVHDSDENIVDIEVYIRKELKLRKGLQDFVAAQKLNDNQFVKDLGKKSEGNFMYLRYVLTEIERGIYKDLILEALPVGLQNYYEDHWRRMGMADRNSQFAKIKIVYVLAEIRRPASRRLVSDFAREDELTVQVVFDEWQPFLHEQLKDEHIFYSLYHTSFREFLHRKEIIKAAGITLNEINALIVENLWPVWQELFDHE